MSNKSKKLDPSTRAKSTSALNSAPTQTQPLPPHPSLSGYNSSRTRFAAVVSAGIAGGQRLRCWDLERSAVVKEWDLPLDGVKGENGGVRSLTWAQVKGLNASATETDGEEDGSSKKRRKRKSVSGTGASQDEETEIIIVAQASSLFYYSIASAGVKTTKTISLSTKPLAITILGSHILTASPETFEVIEASTGSVSLSTPLPEGFTPPSGAASAMTISVIGSSEDQLHLAIASSNLTILSLPLPLSTASKEKVEWVRPQSIAIEPVRQITPLPISDQDTFRFITIEEDSRIATIWSFSSEKDSVDTIATIPLPTSEPVHSIATYTTSGDVELYLISLSGEIQIYQITGSTFNPETAPTTPDGKKKRGKKTAPIPSLQPVSKLSVTVPSVGNDSVTMRIIGCGGVKPGQGEGMEVDDASAEELVVGWMGGAGRVRWEKLRIREVGGGLIPEVLVKRTGQELITSESIEGATPLQRFKESTASNNASRAIMSEEEKNLAQKDLELPVEGDLADLTLGERLAVLEPDHVPAGTKSERRAKRTGVEDGEEDGVEEEDQEEGQKLGPQSTQSLTRLLLQALHTSDPSLLTLILTSPQNSTPGMVRNTIRKLPASMALPLLKACVERLGKGRGFERRGGGRGGGLSGKEGGCVVAWIRGVLVERGSILMTIPSLPVHLASLSQLLQTRLQLHTPLLSLSGRLDLALAQIELRKSLVPPKPKRQGAFYVEGESDSEDDEEDSDDDEDMDDDVEVEGDDEDIGEVEDVRLESRRETESRSAEGDEDEDEGRLRMRALDGRKGKSRRELLVASDEDDDEDADEDDLEDDDDEDDYDEDDDSEDDRPRGLIDDEAEEASDDDDDEDMEE